MQDSIVFGVIGGTAQEPCTLYLNTPQSLSKVSNLSGPVKVTEVFRIAANCAEQKCVHFDGTKCRLAQKVVELDPAVESLAPCPIRVDCKWWQQEGKEACLRCPFIVTEHYNPSQDLRLASDPKFEHF
jgi:hypothetical protein